MKFSASIVQYTPQNVATSQNYVVGHKPIPESSHNHLYLFLLKVSLGLMVNPPKPGDASYKQFIHEKDSLLNSLKRRARLMTDAFNALEGVTCQETEGEHIDLLAL